MALFGWLCFEKYYCFKWVESNRELWHARPHTKFRRSFFCIDPTASDLCQNPFRGSAMHFYLYHTIVGLLTVLFVLPPVALASARGDQRLALVIGNSRYINSPLANPVNDAEDIAAALEKTGFEVILKTDANRRAMEQAVRDFGRRLRSGGVGLFYYAGHGLQIDGRNYLIPVDAVIESESDARYESVDAGRVLGKMEDAGNGLNIVILDACRDNPFARSFRSGQKGLAKMDAPVGSLLAYSTAPGSVAADGTGRNGLYTSKLLRFIHAPGIKIEDMFKQVRREVMAESGKKQVPWESSSMAGDFYFTPEPQKAAASPVPNRAIEIKATDAVLQPQKQLILEKQSLMAERKQLEAERKLFDEKRQLVEEKRQFEQQKAELAALQAKMKADRQKEHQPNGERRLAYAPSVNDRQGAGPGYRLALFPEHAKLDPNYPRKKKLGTLSITPMVKAALDETLDVLSGRKDVRLTDSAIHPSRLSQKADEFQDLRIVSDQLKAKDLAALWHRPSAFSKIEPNIEQAVALGKAIGVDLVLMHRMVKKFGQNDITIYLIDVSRKEVYKKNLLIRSSRYLKKKTEALLDSFIEKRPLSAIHSG
jgi:uncharacterized caspase-like protein